MKTTLRLDDELLREAKKRAAETGTTLTHLVEEALRGALTLQPGVTAYEFRPVTVKGTRPPAADIDDRDALIEFMEGRI